MWQKRRLEAVKQTFPSQNQISHKHKHLTQLNNPPTILLAILHNNPDHPTNF